MNIRFVAVAAGALAIGSVTPSSAQAPPGIRVQHSANLGNIINNFTKIEHPSWNGNANAILLVQPIGVQKQVGVFYDAPSSRWAVFNEDKSGMTNGAKFNVVSDGGFVHRATAANTSAGWTRIDNPATNNQSSRRNTAPRKSLDALSCSCTDMGTAAVVGIAEPGGGWRGVYVGYDGIPERLGRALLDLSFDLGNDLNAVWSFVARAPEGWRFAFSEAYEPGDNREYFQTGRSEPFLRNDDPFVRDNVAFSFILDPEARTLAIHDNTSGPARLDERVRFLDDHRLAFDHGPADPLDWRNRHTDRGTDDPAETAQYLLAMLDEALPIVSTTIALCTLAREKHPAALTAEGFIVPVVLYVTEPDATSDNGVRVTDIVEHDHYRLLPRRALSHRLRCELALAAALEAIATQAKRRVASASLETLSELFPFDLLDLALDESTLQAAIRTRISDCFEPG